MAVGGIPYSIVLYGVYRPVRDFCHGFLASAAHREPSTQEIFIADACSAALAELCGLFFFVPGELVYKRT